MTSNKNLQQKSKLYCLLKVSEVKVVITVSKGLGGNTKLPQVPSLLVV